VAAVADATAPGRPSAIALANGGGTGGAYVNAANRGAVAVSVTLPAGSLSSDTVRVTVTNGANSVSGTVWAPSGPGTVTVSGLNLSGLADGTLTITSISTDFAGNVSASFSVTVTKDTVAPAAPTAAYTNNNGSYHINGTAEANAAITATRTSPLPNLVYAAAANGSGAYSVTIPSPGTATMTYAVTARDAAGNTSAATTVTASDNGNG
jgi:hypothetical protein